MREIVKLSSSAKKLPFVRELISRPTEAIECLTSRTYEPHERIPRSVVIEDSKSSKRERPRESPRSKFEAGEPDFT